MAKEKPIEVDGEIKETLPNANFRVVLDNGERVDTELLHRELNKLEIRNEIRNEIRDIVEDFVCSEKLDEFLTLKLYPKICK